MSQVSLLPLVDTFYLKRAFLNGDGTWRLNSAEDIQRIPLDHLRIWAVKNARYQIPTKELIDFLRDKIGTRSALEIGAGMGDLGQHLGIHMTDSAHQVERPEVFLYYQTLGQAPTNPPPSVERIGAHAAIDKYRPQVVIGAWITQKFREGDTHGNEYGPDEEEIIRNCETYIHIGNEGSHWDKRIRKFKHQSFKFPWLVSRAADQSKNIIYIWEK